MLAARKETKAKLGKEESKVYLDRVEFLVNGVPKVNLEQEVLLAQGDCREILVKEDRRDQQAPRVLRVHQVYKVYKA